MFRRFALLLALTTACAPKPEAPTEAASPAAPPPAQASPASPAAQASPGIGETARALFKPLPAEAAAPDMSEERIALGRALYYDPRLSKDGDLSCNSCHDLQKYGVDGEATSKGHKGQRGNRNSPTVYHAALHSRQFWDGRAKDVEEQAKGPVLNPVEMATADAGAVEATLKGIPGYQEMFQKAFPGSKDPVTFDNVALAIGAFERRLMTPSPFDKYLAGDDAALTPEQLKGMQTFVEVGCASCHNGVAMGGATFQKLGLKKPFETKDEGRFAVTKKEADKFVFKVPSLRNVEKTGPYFHDGSVKELDQVVRLMGEHQLGMTLTDEQVKDIMSFLGALTGEIPADYVKQPPLPGKEQAAL